MTAPADFLSGASVGSANLNAFIDRKTAKVAKAVAQPIPNNAATLIAFGASDTTVTDPLSMFDSTNHRLTIPTGYGGIWLVVANFSLVATSQSGAMREAIIRKNGTAVASDFRPAVAYGASYYTHLSVAALVAASAADYFDLQVLQNSGVALNTGTGEGNVDLAATWISL